ncbi:MAG: glycerol-3-phosphate acyltransferase [Actinomycetota bacterium]|nr:glycerol-3-phosphate acyltransferase [Actinomycetota bacterium]MDQ3575026.1 glycerol-3-phosphate acyltransferase [Actinomycetota bacterium]
MGLARLSAAALLGYVTGTVPSADMACRLATGSGADLRSRGTRNPGAANALVVLGRRWGYSIMAADIAKGVAACMAGRGLAGDVGAHVAGPAAVIGHCFPVWNGFKGGKGVAVSVGQCLATFPVYVPVDLVVAGATAAGRWRSRTFTTTVVASSVWVAASALWWRRGWPNGWGPRPSAALPVSAAVSTAVILSRFLASPRVIS